MGVHYWLFILALKFILHFSLMTIILFVFPFHFEALQEFEGYPDVKCAMRVYVCLPLHSGHRFVIIMP
jgi:hypothetical protein